MKIKQFRYSVDNLGYLVHDKKTGIAIDGGAPEAILAFAKDHGIQIKYVANTHSHYDHTTGNQTLLDSINAHFIDCRSIISDQTETELFIGLNY